MSNPNNAPPSRWVRDYVFDILGALGINYIFGVPGTNEIPIIDGCDLPANQGKVRYIECLHENIAIGAASGYARMTGKPGVVLVHVMPGIGHSLGNLFNAARSQIPLVVLCGQQQDELVTQEPLLASNLVRVASQYTKWSHEARTWKEMGLVLQRAFKEALAPPTGPVFVSIPWDFLVHEIGPDDRVPGVTRVAGSFPGDPEEIKRAAATLAKAKNPVIIAGDALGAHDGWKPLQELAELLGAPVYLEGFSSLVNFPNSDYHWQGELPGDQKQTQQRLAPYDVGFFVGFTLQAQLAVFKYADGPLIPSTLRQIYLDNNTWNIGKNHYAEAAILGDPVATLAQLNVLVAKNRPRGAGKRNSLLKAASKKRDQAWKQYLDKARQADRILAVLVADALREKIAGEGLERRFVFVNEAVSDFASFQTLLPLGEEARPTSYYCTGGGSLGWSMPASLGIKLSGETLQGVKTDLVVNAVGDGSALFYPQTWWTAAHRELAVLYIVMDNREYHTLQVGLQQVVDAYGSAPGYGWKPVTMTPEYLLIRQPEVDFLSLARAFGVADGAKVIDVSGVREAVYKAVDYVRSQNRSYVLQVQLEGAPPPPPSTALSAASLPGLPQPPPVDFYYHENFAEAKAAGKSVFGGRKLVF